MSDTLSSPKDFVEIIRNQAWRIWEDALFCTAGHTQECRWWESITLWLGIPTTVIAAVTGITSLSSSGDSPLILGLGSSVIIPVLAFTVAAMSGLSTFLDPKGQASKHYLAASEYQALVNDIQFFCQIECTSGSSEDKLKESLRKFNVRLNKLNSQPIIISKRAMSIAKKEIKAGKYNYEIDMVNQKPADK